LVELRKILVPRRRRKPRADAPKTIVPLSTPAERFDAAKRRLRDEIPPKSGDDD
jgi:hypothetical protein